MSDQGPYSNYRLTARLELKNRPGLFASVASALARSKANLGAADRVEDEKHGGRVIAALRNLRGVRIVSVSDRIFLMHLGGDQQVCRHGRHLHPHR